ncbi:nucleotidyltransferase family protein [Nitrosomonas sp.]|uniref:nucleotidyltransferase domain-containing protein n=1 Tax=Nitrosomonas sp. TaxID=42353 RepID=UPI00284422CD|nr:nucleotidyltransferase family protein [Nitrosomonas sp.]MDR4514810.1 nucleotidyltransferase family protein [Nitrosomonas sp.]
MKLDLSQHSLMLVQGLINPDSLTHYSESDWELLIRLARRVKLLGRLTLLVKEHGLWNQVPTRIASQLTSGLVQVEKLQQLNRWELNRILWALDEFNTSIIALKGIAYGLAEIPYATGRLSVDLDLLIPKADLADIESLLTVKGWRHRTLSAYDERYYRVWSHEIPPLVHVERETEVDIHHTLAPLTSRLKIDTRLLFEAAIPTKDKTIKLLSPVDMVIHCAVNLFQNNEIANDLRDLLDLHDLLVFFSVQDADFWLRLTDRANQLRLAQIMFYGLHFSQLIFKTPVPGKICNRLRPRPGKLKLWIMHRLVPLALFPQHPDKPTLSASMARFVLYLRSHLIRMPLYILLPHLIYKTMRMIRLKSGNNHSHPR